MIARFYPKGQKTAILAVLITLCVYAHTHTTNFMYLQGESEELDDDDIVPPTSTVKGSWTSESVSWYCVLLVLFLFGWCSANVHLEIQG